VITQTELEALLENLARNQKVTLGTGNPARPDWFRAEVVSHDAASGLLIVTCFMDRSTDRPLEPGERVLVSATRKSDELHSAPMDVELSSGGPVATVQLRIAGTWQPEDERRHQVRVPVHIRPRLSRRWSAGAWREVDARVDDISSRGVGLHLRDEVRVGDRVSLILPLEDGQPDLRLTVEVRHMHHQPTSALPYRAGGLFRTLSPGDHERIVRFVFAELRSRHAKAV
jgi:PilZ domain